MKHWQGIAILVLILGAVGTAWYFVTKVSAQNAAILAGKEEPSNFDIKYGIG